MTYDEFNVIVNIEGIFKKIDQPCFLLPEYKDGKLTRSSKEVKKYKIEGMYSEYSMEEICNNTFDKDIRKLFFEDIKNKCMEIKLTHFYDVNMVEDCRKYNIYVRGFVDPNVKYYSEKVEYLNNIEEVLK